MVYVGLYDHDAAVIVAAARRVQHNNRTRGSFYAYSRGDYKSALRKSQISPGHLTA